MKKAFLILVLYSGVFALQAPYLLGASALTDSSIQINWRNNDIASEGFIVVRQMAGTTGFIFDDSVTSSTASSYTDNHLADTTTYSYKVLAFGGGVLSDSSNVQTATTYKISPCILTQAQAPTIDVLWDNSGATRRVKLTIYDHSTCEEGFAIIRIDYSSLPNTTYYLLGNVQSLHPELNDTIFWYDTSVHANAQLAYKVSAYHGQDSIVGYAYLETLTVSQKPVLEATWDTSGLGTAVHLTVQDNAYSEDGYAIYRSDDSASFKQIYFKQNTSPGTSNNFVYIDSSVQINAYYTYKVAVFQGPDSLWDTSSKIYTYHVIMPDFLVKLSKISTYPIYWGGLTAVSGDSIFLKESNSPSGSFSIININDVLHPKFAGYADSTGIANLNLPPQSLVPVFMKLNTYNTFDSTRVLLLNDKMLCLKNEMLYLFGLQANSLVLQDSLAMSALKIDSCHSIRILPIFGNNGIMVEQYTGSPYYHHLRVQPVNLNANPFNFPQGLPTGGTMGSTSDASMAHYIYCSYRYNFLGYDGDFVYYTHQDQCCDYQPCTTWYAVSASLNAQDGFPTDSSLTLRLFNLHNTSQIFSPFSGLFCDTIGHYFGIDIRNLNSLKYYSDNHLDYLDSIASTAGGIKNVILDTLTKRVYLFYGNYLSILGYSYVTNFSTLPVAQQPVVYGPSLRNRISCVFVKNVLRVTGPSGPFSVSLYEISGRLVDKLESAGNGGTLCWKPRARLSNNVYLVRIESGEIQKSVKLILTR